MTKAVMRVDELQAAQNAIVTASIWERPFVFLRNVDSDIARATWQIFKPAVPTTIEGLVYAGIGMLVLLLVYHAGVRYPITRIARMRHARHEARAY